VRNLIAILAIGSLGSSCYAQTPSFSHKDTLRFAADSSYSRAVARFGKELVFGTSKSGVVALNEQTGTTRTLEPAHRPDEFRDVAVRNGFVYMMTSGDNGLVLYRGSKAGGMVTSNEGIFFDDLSLNDQAVMILGDPVDGHFFLQLHTKDSIQSINWITNKPGEACYAASGTTAQFLPDDRYCFVSGGIDAARFHRFNWKTSGDYTVLDLPMVTGEGAGPFSVHFMDAEHGMIVGGNYTQPNDTTGTAVYTTDGGTTWQQAEAFPKGYRSCVTGNKKVQFVCGSNGIDYSTDGGKTWHFFDKGNFCALLLEKKYLYATTNRGYCIRYRLK
jgi:hypothetical protein